MRKNGEIGLQDYCSEIDRMMRILGALFLVAAGAQIGGGIYLWTRDAVTGDSIAYPIALLIGAVMFVIGLTLLWKRTRQVQNRQYEVVSRTLLSHSCTAAAGPPVLSGSNTPHTGSKLEE